MGHRSDRESIVLFCSAMLWHQRESESLAVVQPNEIRSFMTDKTLSHLIIVPAINMHASHPPHRRDFDAESAKMHFVAPMMAHNTYPIDEKTSGYRSGAAQRSTRIASIYVHTYRIDRKQLHPIACNLCICISCLLCVSAITD